MSDSIHTPENPDEQKDARTVGMDEVVIYDAVQRLVRRVDKQAAEIEALRTRAKRLCCVLLSGTEIASRYMDTERGDLDGWLELADRTLNELGGCDHE